MVRTTKIAPHTQEVAIAMKTSGQAKPKKPWPHGSYSSAATPATEPASSTLFPEAPLSLPAIKLDSATRNELGITMRQLIDVNLGNRSAFDRQLDVNNSIYEMRKGRPICPGPTPPTSPCRSCTAAVNEYVSRINGTIFGPRLLTVRGNDPISSQYAHLTEEYYNTRCDKDDWTEAWETCVHLAARDGISYSTCFWDLSTHEEIRYANDPVTGPDGAPTDQTQKVAKRISFVDYDGPRFRAVEARDLVWIPNYAPDKNAADGVAIKYYMSEIEMRKMVSAGIFDEDDTERILSYTDTARGEQSFDVQGYRTYTIGGLINVADQSVAPPAKLQMSRGPVQMWMIFTKQFVFNKKTGFQEVVVWVHDRSRICPGVAPFEYWKGRPIFPLALIPRPNRIYGFALPQILQGIQEEADTQHNQRLNWMDMLLQPVRWRTGGVRISEEDKIMGPGTEIRVMKKDDFGWYDYPDRSQPTVGEEEMLLQYKDMATGAPQTPGLGGGQQQGAQRSARAAQTSAAVQGLMTNLVLRRVRKFVLANFEYAASLTQQYGTDQVQTVQKTAQGAQDITLPKEVLMLNYTYGIAGQGGPLDKEQRRQDMMLLSQILLMTPLSQLMQGNIPRIWTLARALIETFDVPEVTTFIGTMQDAMAQQQAMQQQQEQQQQLMQQAELMKQVFSHTDFKQPTAPKRGGNGQAGPQQPMLGMGG